MLNMLKNNKLTIAILAVCCLLAGTAPARTAAAGTTAVQTVVAQLSEDDDPVTVVFRFESESDAFYLHGNSETLDSLLLLLDPAQLAPGAIRVEGYSPTKSLSKVRCNRVKSELITRRGVREEHFTTRNLTGTFGDESNVVVVTVPLPRAAESAAPAESQTLPTPAEQPEQPAQSAQAEPETAGQIGQAAAENTAEQTEPATESVVETPESGTATESTETKKCHTHFALRANLLRWATLTPDLGIEWRLNRSWSVLVNSSYTSWNWSDKKRNYGLWELNPEVRLYMGKTRRGYLGAMYKVGSFHYKFSETGRQGDLMGGGLTGGYVVRLNRALSLDLSAGVGYVHANFDKYTVIDGVRVRQGSDSKNRWGLTSVGVSLVWNLY